jgi:hypothetical protein
MNKEHAKLSDKKGTGKLKTVFTIQHPKQSLPSIYLCSLKVI